MSESSDKIFSWIGKFSVIIGLMVGIVTLYNIANPKEPKLYAQCNVVSIPLTPFEDDFFKKNDDFKYYHYRFSSKYFMQCKIINDGDMEASQIQFLIPDDIIYAECISKIGDIEYKKNVIEINSLRPQTSTELNIWVHGSYPLSSKLQINSKEVSGKIDIGKVYYGKIADISDILLFISEHFLALFVFSILIIIFITLQIYLTYINEKKSKNENTEGNHGEE